MTDQIRIYHSDDPNDAPERRLSAFPTINPFIPTSLPQYVIPPVANSLYTAMQYYWYSAYQQGIAAQKQQQQQQQQQHHQQQHQHLMHQQQQQQLLSQHQHQHQEQQQHQLLHHQQTKHQLSHHNHHSHLSHQAASPSSSLGLTNSSSSSTSSSASNTNLASSSNCSSTSSVIAPSSAASSAGSSAASPVTSTTPASNHNQQPQTPHQHIKKPLNPFMIYMQKRRPEIVKQGIIKESAAINQMLGQQWRELSKEEQEPYYKLAEQEKILHAQKYPGWSARDNYANQKKKKKMKMKSISLNGMDQSDKKCRARFGLNNMASWCKPCRRKKKCAIANAANNRNSYHSLRPDL